MPHVWKPPCDRLWIRRDKLDTTTCHSLRRVSDAIEFMEVRLSENLSLDMIARAANCSKHHFHRMFSMFMGITVLGYLQRRRLTEAAKSLVDSDKPIIHIALAAGYESQQAFSSIFALMYKKPPNQFRKDAVFYPLQLPIDLTGAFKKNRNREVQWHVSRAKFGDISVWMDLVRLAINGFPYFDENEYLDALHKHLRLGSALIVKDGEIAIGILLYSPDCCHIDYLAIHPLYRESGVAEAMIDELLVDKHEKETEISITTYRKNDKADPGQRNALQTLGFIEDKQLIEFGYPTQKFILRHIGCKYPARLLTQKRRWQ